MSVTASTLDMCDFDPHDAWGSAMGALFDVAHALEHYGTEYVPAAWQYRDSLVCNGLERHMSGENDTARTIAAIILSANRRGNFSDERDIVHAGDVLHRYTRMLERAGRSY